MATDKHVMHAKMASDVWEQLAKEQKQALGKYFHLRPTSTGVTIVSTLPISPMRGLPTSSADELRRTLLAIFKNFARITSDDDKKAKTALTELRFKNRETGHKGLEEYIQAVFINMMEHDRNLQNVLKSKGPIRFIASEVIFKKGPYRIDVVGCDEENLYLFELKKDRTLDYEQAQRYRDYYTDTDNRAVLDSLLSVYPINKIDQCEKKNIRPVMLMRYAENSSNKTFWRDRAGRFNIDIIFYRDSLEFKGVVQ